MATELIPGACQLPYERKFQIKEISVKSVMGKGVGVFSTVRM